MLTPLQSNRNDVPPIFVLSVSLSHTVDLQWLEYLWFDENMFETGVVRANEC